MKWRGTAPQRGDPGAGPWELVIRGRQFGRICLYIWKSVKTRGRLLRGRAAVTPPSLPPELSARLSAGEDVARPLSPDPAGGSAGRRSLASARIFRNIRRLGFLAAGRCWLCRQLRLLKPSLPPAVCSPPLPRPPSPPGAIPNLSRPTRAQAARIGAHADAPQVPARSTSVFWPRALGSPWQPLRRSCGPASPVPPRVSGSAASRGPAAGGQGGGCRGGGEGRAAGLCCRHSCVRPRAPLRWSSIDRLPGLNIVIYPQGK